MKNRYLFLAMFASSVFGAFLSALIILSYIDNEPVATKFSALSISDRQKKGTIPVANLFDSSTIIPKGINFVNAARSVTSGVVHIRSSYSSGGYSINPLDGLFNNPSQSSGSGVIISDDGFIATNNHVIEDASEIEVVLNDNRSFRAKIMGTDPTTDLALLKIDALEQLPFIQYGNSDRISPGEWVLAIGNPFDLNSTVTAGIVSAKARNIGILRDKSNLQIESFIQTDAAVNPGNSGGALVNLQGELVGINTAIATPTGTYAGYSFAVPVALVKKVMDDLLEFGEVQRGLLGIRIGDVDARLARARDLKVVSGVFVSGVNNNSSAEEAGIEEGDVIVAIDDMTVNNVSELQEFVARNRPGDQIKVTYLRNDKQRSVTATLRNTEGTTEIVKTIYPKHLEGALLENLELTEMNKLDVNGGVRLKDIGVGKWQDAGIKNGFVITSIDKLTIADVADLHRILKNKNGGILIEGINPNGEKNVFGIDW
ncbi:PDZ domain-containing protein [Fulvivirga sp. M361]|uniref:S1C family serine protease n=1 Tax=Fulvivirga sp. M361 TaxID=2594266 RepID=UPI001179A168|nr:trypsin-like peptidase domain-containing protein [Fulvivirga sp. M361]TRX48204.1 PDZ domain-containing protein [Fulvivirga sp. M361]